MRCESNLSDVVSGLIVKVNSLNDADKLFRQAALDTVALISDRVQQDGLKTNETPIKSFYSLGYGKKRKKKGLQTQFVDLTFSGDMMGEFLPAPYNDGWVVGFRTQKQGDIADFNEQRFGLVFNLSDKESETVIKGITGVVNDTFR